MRYMLFIKHEKDYGGVEAPPALYGAMGEFIEQAAKQGVFIDGGGLKPLAEGARVRLAGGEISVNAGPFDGASGVVGGYAICECDTHEDAVELARKFMDLHRIHWPGFEGESEVRPFQEE